RREKSVEQFRLGSLREYYQCAVLNRIRERVLERFFQYAGASDPTGQPALPPKSREGLRSLDRFSKGEEVPWFGFEAEQHFAEVFRKWHTVNYTRIPVFEQVVAGQADLGETIAKLSHEWIHSFAKDAVHLTAAASSTKQGFKVVDGGLAEMIGAVAFAHAEFDVLDSISKTQPSFRRVLQPRVHSVLN